eukprot:9298994-Heterocapsa_arctica.AAC.1
MPNRVLALRLDDVDDALSRVHSRSASPRREAHPDRLQVRLKFFYRDDLLHRVLEAVHRSLLALATGLALLGPALGGY